MNHFLVVVDMQKDFVNGSLGTAEAEAMVPRAAEKIRNFEGEIFVTYDTHFTDYMDSAEGKKLPVPHCIRGTEGWQPDPRIGREISGCLKVEKPTFGSIRLARIIRELAEPDDSLEIELMGLCTDICVVSNALLLKAHFPEAAVGVHESCCAGVTPDRHRAALETMASCQIDIL